MYFRVKRDSKTGKDLALLQREAERAIEAAKNLARKHRAETFSSAYWVAFGGISSLQFKKPPSENRWKKVNGGHMPKKTTKQGKAWTKEMEDLPTVSIDRMNSCVGFNEPMMKRIGLSFRSDEYIGFIVGDDWKYTPPKDAEEITVSEFRKTFPS